MFVSGVRTGMIVTITRTVQAVTQQVQARALPAFFAAAAGATTPSSAVLPIGTATAPRAAASAAAFVLQGLNSAAYTLYFYLKFYKRKIRKE